MIIGTAGHVDHGKTSLVRALTGVETDRLKEEKARGISIDLGFAYLPVPEEPAPGEPVPGKERRLGFVDVPGHERFVGTMLAGAGGIDFALVVVAADDGPMPQTLEHLAILDLLGITRGLVALTKSDLVDPDRLAAAEAEIRAALAPTGLAGLDVLPVSTRTGEGIELLRDLLFGAAREAAARPEDGAFRLSVDRCFSLAGAGTVVTGTVLSGRVAVGDRVLIGPAGTPARVRAIHARGEPAETGRAGDRCALNLAGDGIGRDSARRGDVVMAPELHGPTLRIDAELRLLASEPKALGPWMPVHLHYGAADVPARLVPLSDGPLVPGATGLVQLVLGTPLAAAIGDRFVLRDTSARRTIGGGRFLDLRGPARKRRTPERLALLAASGLADPAEALGALLAAAPFHVDLPAFARDRALRAGAAEALADRLGLVRLGPVGLAPATWERARLDLAERLSAFHAANPDLMGIGIERLRLQAEPRFPAPLFRALLASLVRAGEIAVEGAWVRLASHDVQLTPADETRWAQVVGLIGGPERFRPPRVRDLAGTLGAPEPEMRRLLKLAGRLGRADEVAHDHFFLRPTVAEMVDIVARLSKNGPEGGLKGEFTAAQFRDEVENGRKVAIQILEFLDRHGVTLRRGDLRRVNPHRLDLFRAMSGGPGMPGESLDGGEASPVGRPDFKSGRGREPVPGGFDSHSLPPLAGLSA